MRQKVVSHKDVQQDVVVNDIFEVVFERKHFAERCELELEVLTQQRNVQQVELLPALCRGARSPRPECHVLTQQRKVGIMAYKAKHDKVSIQTIEAMARITIIARLGACCTDVLHDLVLALSWYIMAREDHTHTTPVGVLRYLLGHKVLKLLGQSRHERSARGDAVRVEWVFFRQFFASPDGLLALIPRFLCCAETTATLLIHLGARRNAINGKEKELARLDRREKVLDIRED